MPSILNATTTNGLVTSADNSGSLQLQTNNGTTAMTIDTSQNVGIGTTSPVAGARLAIVGGGTQLSGGTSAQEGVRFQRISGAATITGINNDNNAYNDIAFYTQGSEGARLTTGNNFQFNSGYGSVATAYGCRAWVNFNGQGTVAIRASGNVSSITDNATGRYTLNLSTALPDVNFALAGNASFRDSTDDGNSGVVAIRRLNSVSITTTAIPIQTTYYGANGTLDDFPFINAMVIR